MEPNNIKSASVEYGRAKEPVARHSYEELYSCSVIEVGVMTSTHQPWLCASLDGVVVIDRCISRLVEIKCPSSCENVPVTDSKLQKINYKHLEFYKGEVYLRRSSQYYTQIQVQMYMTGICECDLFIYSPVQSYCVRILRDESFIKDVILVSEEFYFSNLLSALCERYSTVKIDDCMQTNKAEERPFTGQNIGNITSKKAKTK